eukprot:6900412-Alexandrium_andersonii.AAC.1
MGPRLRVGVIACRHPGAEDVGQGEAQARRDGSRGLEVALLHGLEDAVEEDAGAPLRQPVVARIQGRLVHD